MTYLDSDILVEQGRGVRAEGVEEALADAVRRVLSGSNGHAGVAGLVRVVVPVRHESPLAWLSAQTIGPRFYWRGRSEAAPEIAGLGIADEIRTDDFERLDVLYRERRELLGSPGKDARYFGGAAFDLAAPAAHPWTTFPPVWFFLPRFEMQSEGGESRLICNLVLPRDRDRAGEIIEQIGDLTDVHDRVRPEPSALVERTNLPENSAWKEAVSRVLAMLEAGQLGKVVMARQARFEFAAPIDAFGLLERLARVTPSCFHFLIEIAPGVVFAGASPERLFRREGRAVSSEAVAGTRPRGTSARDDERLRDELLLSKKDRLEHAFVEQSIRRALEALCTEVAVDPNPSAMTLARGRHIYSGIGGTLRRSVGDVHLLRALHPTPAVGGHPTEVALELIREIEPFVRGWYAGPVGWMNSDSSEFAVAIRTGLVHSNVLTLYSGAGIVSGSEPQAEWDEIEHKIGDFTSVLDLDLDRAKY